MKKKNSESGEIMLEGMIIVILTVFILFWLLAVGFLHYERYLVTAVTNNAAKKVATTYSNPTTDMVMGYIEIDDISKRDLYRRLGGGDLEDVNESRVEAYLKYMFSKLGVVDNLTANLEFTADNFSSSRGHVKLTVNCSFVTPFGGMIEAFGLKGLLSFESVAYAECQDLSNYVMTTDFVTGVTDFDQSKTVKMINNTFKLIYKRKYEQQ